MPQTEYETGNEGGGGGASRAKRPLTSNKQTGSDQSGGNNNNLTILYLLKSIFLFWLPHAAIIVLFLVYSLLGAAILNEIESSDRIAPATSSKYDSQILPQKAASKEAAVVLNKNNPQTSSLALNNLLQQHVDKTYANLEQFHVDFEKTIDVTLNLSQQSNVGVSSELDKDDLETFTFFSRLYNKHKTNMNVEKMFKSIAKHMIEFKMRLKANLTQNLKSVVNEFGESQARLNGHLNKVLASTFPVGDGDDNQNSKYKSIEFGQQKTDNLNWRFSNYAYFIGSYLTTIGYGSMSPRTVIGKLFTMIYLIIGLPLTLILLSDLGSLLTRLIKFTSLFTYTIYTDGYYDNFKDRLDKRRRAIIDTLKSSRPNKVSKKRRSSGDSADENNDSDEDLANAKRIEPSLLKSLLEIGFNCMKQCDDEFDLSLGASISFVFAYLTLGAVMISRLAECSIFNGYYSSLIALTKIGFGDLIKEPSGGSQFTWAMAVYALVGMAFFDLTVLSLQEKMRILLIKNARNILQELVKFANQLGYSSWTMDSVNFENLGKNSIHKIYTRVPSTAPIESSDLDDVFYNYNTKIKRINSQKNFAPSKTKKLNKDQHCHDSHHHYYELPKCDKQTQITTLLCSKFKYEKNGLSSSLSSIPESVSSSVTMETINPDEKSAVQEKVALIKANISVEPSTPINKTSIEVYQQDGEGSLKARRSRFQVLQPANSNITSSVNYQKK